ncbi:MAG: amidohydrolase family protein [Sphaerochaetaceae bacterium]|nr:amidohydrolase family protein [Sphaerochaetaceae bacterium]
MGYLLIKNAHIITPLSEILHGFIVTKGKYIHYIGDLIEDEKKYNYFKQVVESEVDFKGNYALPGFIDIHTHGVLGKDYSDSPELVKEEGVFRASKGITGFLPTLGAFVSPEKLLSSADKLTKYIKDVEGGAKPLGINLEAPFLRPDIGAHDAANCFWSVDIKYLKRAKKIMGNSFKIITIAPELENSMDGISFLRSEGVIPSIGHTMATEKELDAAIRHGANLVTHLLNTTYQPEQNLKGIMLTGANEYLLTRDDIMAEAIVDTQGIHINPTMLKILVRCKGIKKIIMISDSFITPGTEPGRMFIMPNGQEVYEENGVNIQAVRKHVCGSAMTIDVSFRSMMNHTGLSVPEVSQMTSLNPAKILGLADRKGSLEIGKDADIISVNNNIEVQTTIVEGVVVYNKCK